jgi:hypothetical protein
MSPEKSKKQNGEGGIRTRGTPKGTPVFETGSLSRSDTSPILYILYTPKGKIARILTPNQPFNTGKIKNSIL